jgi:hypothetical protein
MRRVLLALAIVLILLTLLVLPAINSPVSAGGSDCACIEFDHDR